MTFSMLYAFTENFVLPLSHDEVVHGKGSLINKMPGDLWQQFANLRLLYGYMTAHPGKKLLFMGGEFGQRSEWNHEHQPAMGFAAISRASRSAADGGRSELRSTGGSRRCTKWISSGRDFSGSIATMRTPACCRSSVAPGSQWDAIVIVANFTPVAREKYRVGVPDPGWYRELFNSDARILWRKQLRECRRSDGRAGAVDGHELLVAAASAAAGDAVFQAAVKRLASRRRANCWPANAQHSQE